MVFKMRNPLKHKLGDSHDKIYGVDHEATTPEEHKALIDPDAPGIEGEPGYEPPVRREDLDELGKKIWDCQHDPKTKWNNKTKECEPIK